MRILAGFENTPGHGVCALKGLRKIQASCLNITTTFLQQKTEVIYSFAATCLDSISSRFNVLNTPISTTAPIDAKTHV
jgi:hypothetical protein